MPADLKAVFQSQITALDALRDLAASHEDREGRERGSRPMGMAPPCTGALGRHGVTLVTAERPISIPAWSNATTTTDVKSSFAVIAVS